MTDIAIENIWSRLWATRFSKEDIRLRFELGGKDLDNIRQPITRFFRAHRRASNISDALFRKNCVAIVAQNNYLFNPLGFSEEANNGFDALIETGFTAKQIGEWTADLYPAPNRETCLFRSYDLGSDKTARDLLLWHAITAEMPIYPSAPITTFLFDPLKCIMMHVYDDRGMDVLAFDAVKLHPIYTDFADWLLDHDRPRMIQLF